MWLSVIIPAYNCRKTIKGVLNSITIQEDPDVEVVICDDQSTDNFMELVEPYKDILHIVYGKTKPHKIHCPGNTRQDGLEMATGDWVTFIDNDDAFEPDTFFKIKRMINEEHINDVIVSYFREWYPDRREYDEKLRDEMTWMHGKFYNRVWLKDHNIFFKEDLESHEDLFFNSKVYASYIHKDIKYHFFPQPTYKWIYNTESLSRSFVEEQYNYLEIHFKDWLYAAAQPWIDDYRCRPEPENKDRLISFMLYSYFYCQGSIYRQGRENLYPGTREAIFEYEELIKRLLNVTEEDIVNWAYTKPAEYTNLKSLCTGGIGPFVEVDSYKDFIADKSNLDYENYEPLFWEDNKGIIGDLFTAKRNE